MEILANQRWKRKSDGRRAEIEPVLLNALRVQNTTHGNWVKGVSFVHPDDAERFVYVMPRAMFLEKYELAQ